MLMQWVFTALTLRSVRLEQSSLKNNGDAIVQTLKLDSKLMNVHYSAATRRFTWLREMGIIDLIP